MEKTDNWAAFGSEYLKAIDVLKNTDEYAVVDVSSREENGKEVLHLTLERDGAEKLFGCNATNTYAVQVACPRSPKDAIGRIVTFNKVDVTNPQTKLLVKGLRLVFKPKDVQEQEHEFGIDDKGEM